LGAHIFEGHPGHPSRLPLRAIGKPLVTVLSSIFFTQCISDLRYMNRGLRQHRNFAPILFNIALSLFANSKMIIMSRGRCEHGTESLPIPSKALVHIQQKGTGHSSTASGFFFSCRTHYISRSQKTANRTASARTLSIAVSRQRSRTRNRRDRRYR